MPKLRDTEWRVLCVVVRQTLGWRGMQDGTRRTSDWLTRAQLRRRTGRQSEALSGSIDALVRRGLIEVADEDGEPLITPAKRRRAKGRIAYRLSPRVISAGRVGAAKDDGRKSEHGKPNTTKRKGYINKGSKRGQDSVAIPDASPAGNWTRAADVGPDRQSTAGYLRRTDCPSAGRQRQNIDSS